MLQLYRLTNSDIEELNKEYENLKVVINGLELILSDPEKLKSVMKSELRKVRDEYATPRKSLIKDEITDISINEEEMIPKEDVIVLVTRDGQIKRTSKRSYKEDEKPLLKEFDHIIGLFEINTKDVLLLFTNLGNFLYIPVYTIPTASWKELGKHVSNIVKLDSNEEIIEAIKVCNFNDNFDITITSKNGMIKRTKLSDFKLLRYNKPVGCMKLKDDDEVVSVFLSRYNNVFVATSDGYGLWFDINEIPIVGLKTSGVKAINLKDDKVVSVSNFDNVDYITVITNKGTGKRVKLSEFEKSNRARRGLMIVREVKANPYKVVKAFAIDQKEYIELKGKEITNIKLTELSIMDRYSTGNNIVKDKIKDAYQVITLMKKDEEIKVNIEETSNKKRTSIKEIDERLMTIDDFI